MIPTGIDSPEENLKRLLARFSPPQAGASAQPMTGAPPPVSPGISSPGTAVTPVGPKIPSAAAQRQPADEAELRRLTDPTQESHYSGVDQYRHKHPILGTIAKIGDVALGAMFPRVAQMVPGTELHHQGLVNQQEGRVAEDVGQQAKEAGTAGVQATTAHTLAETDALGKPKVGTTPEETTIHDMMTGQNGQPRINPTTNQPYTYFDAYTKVMQAKQDVKPDSLTPAAQFESGYQQYLKDNKFPDTSHNRLLFKEQWDRAEHSVQMRGQDMTDSRQREQNQIARDTKQETAKDKADASLNSFNSDMDRLAAAANELATDPGLAGVTGIKGKLPNIPGGAAANAEAKLNALKSQVAFGVLQNMRNNSKTGGALGAISDKEGELLQNNLASLDKAQSHGELAGSLRKIIQYTNEAKERARQSFQNTYQNGTQPAAPTARPAGGGQEGPTATGPNGHKIKVVDGKWVDATTGKPI